MVASQPVSLDVKWFSMALSPDGRLIAAYSYATWPVGMVDLASAGWDVERDREVRTRLSGRAGGPEVAGLAFGGNGKTLGVRTR